MPAARITDTLRDLGSRRLRFLLEVIMRFTGFFWVLFAFSIGGCTSLLGDFSTGPDDAPTDGSVAETGSEAAAQDGGTDQAAADAGEDVASRCSIHEKACHGVCISSDDPQNGCGKILDCSPCVVPNATATCAASACAIAVCNNGYANCSGGPADGCETNIANDPAHCGNCTTSCAVTGGGAHCAGGSCSTIACTTGLADCDQDAGDGCEVDLSKDPANCGTCKNGCASVNGTGSCAASKCSFACTAPFAHCATSADSDGCNIDTSKDDKNCGTCGKICTGGTTCQNSGCACPANVPKACNGICVDPQTDNSNCGNCGNVCPATATCGGGTCNCPAGSALCNGVCVVVSNDGANCGACGHNCGGGTCAGSLCQPVQIAGGMSPTLPALIVVAGTLYGSWNDANGGGLYSIPVNAPPGKNPPKVFFKDKLTVGSLVSDGTNLWYANNQAGAQFYSTPLATLATPIKASTTFGTGGSVYHFGVQNGHLYWDQGTGTAYQNIGNASTAPVPISPSAIRAIGSDGVFVYWAKGGGAILRGTGDLTQAANQTTLGASPPTSAFDREVRFDANNVYFGDAIGLWRYPKTGGAATPIFNGVTAAESPEQFLVDPDEARNRIYYFALDTTSNNANTIWGANKDGSGNVAQKIVSPVSGHPLAIAADGVAIYWTTSNGELWKLVK